jgi:hypothetical protein
MGYKPVSQLNNSAFCTAGMARVKLWHMWWCVFTMPGMTTWCWASITLSAVWGKLLAGPMAWMQLSLTKMEALRSSSPASLSVAMVWALWMSKVVMAMILHEEIE